MNIVRESTMFNFKLPGITVANGAAKFVSEFPVSCRDLQHCALFDVVYFLLEKLVSIFSLIYVSRFFACRYHMLVNKRLSLCSTVVPSVL